MRWNSAKHRRQRRLHRRLLRARLDPRHLGNVLRGANAGDDVFALGVDQELAVERVLAGRRIAGEGDAGRRGLAHVAEDHRLDVDGRAPGGGNVLQTPIGFRTGIHPAAEDRADRAPQLLLRILRERLAGNLLDLGLVGLDDLLPILRAQIGIEGQRLLVLVGLQDLLELMVIDIEHHVRVHLDEATIGIIGEARVARALGHRLDRLVGEAEVQNRIHHAGHGRAGAGANRNQDRVGIVAERVAGDRAHGSEAGIDLRLEFGRIGLAVLVVIRADLGRDGEARRDRQAEIGHFREVGAFAAEQVAHLGAALGLAVPEAVYPLGHRLRHGRRHISGERI